ncbi:diguanylate cyclase/phosphodiesterase (GGDEF & EAL domains) with PAS/PAC sensor(s) (plasmid) [Sinorhizobium sojae CCBAU 05684]|uniref:Diguanylate cyclase/phosphodiesterase (GGDEF & EAL domains) with PAS/PAC sensor(S) n=1 Tax=Sinorhizobium sojae CCBAU 05684 TaxID=716928 RepID=A0A249PHQ8_9HYPH|nr:EAL domain-containing protein [Sinorhizobium sojae]ASY65224.1 diguanylate cyclase/phosphodiesterase (GGDEF & EAL domains) with PAS/PAC sensor(s) [Sinorhizobium sojae CCBAU 05684]
MNAEKLDLAGGVAPQAMQQERIGFSLQQINAVDDLAKVLYSECLGRFTEPDGTIRTSEELLAMPEISGSPAFDRYLLQLALDWLARHPSCVLGCDIQASSLADKHSSATLYELLFKHRAVARRMILEVTGSVGLKTHSAAMLQNARALGYRIAMEAFGTEHAIARTLPSFPVDIVKIDASLAWHGRGDAAPMLRHIVARASRSASVIVIEGIETYEQLDAAKIAGATHVQGLLLSEPTLPPIYSEPCRPVVQRGNPLAHRPENRTRFSESAVRRFKELQGPLRV